MPFQDVNPHILCSPNTCGSTQPSTVCVGTKATREREEESRGIWTRRGAPARKPDDDASPDLLREDSARRAAWVRSGRSNAVRPTSGPLGTWKGRRRAIRAHWWKRRRPAPIGAVDAEVEGVLSQEGLEWDQRRAADLGPSDRVAQTDVHRRRRVPTEAGHDAHGRPVETDHEVPAGEAPNHHGIGDGAHTEDPDVVVVPVMVHGLELDPGVDGEQVGARADGVAGSRTRRRGGTTKRNGSSATSRRTPSSAIGATTTPLRNGCEAAGGRRRTSRGRRGPGSPDRRPRGDTRATTSGLGTSRCGPGRRTSGSGPGCRNGSSALTWEVSPVAVEGRTDRP